MRLKSLDFLRGIAVILVMFRHHSILPILNQAGWIGVDLFFVLSGFLVSGLLFSEFKKYGNIKPLLFLARRGLKIYPLFYCFLLFMLLVNIKNDKPMTWMQIIGETFFLQNYLDSLVNHTWTLAIEEHFYIFLPILLSGFIFIFKKDPLSKIPLTFMIIAIFCISVRIFNNILYPKFIHDFHQSQSHIRFDSLFFGVLLSYLYHFSRIGLENFFKRYKYLIIILSILFIIPPFLFPLEHKFVNTIGLSLLYVGFGGILMIFLFFVDIDKSHKIFLPILEFISFIGFYSYSVYLWHTTAGGYATKYTLMIFGENIIWVQFLGYFALSILAGVLISKIIEQPFLKIRDIYFPSRSKTMLN